MTIPGDPATSGRATLEIRRCLPSDHDDVVRLHHLGLDEFDADAGPGPWDDDLEDIPNHYFEDGDFIVGMWEGRLVAMGAIRRASSDAAALASEARLPGDGA